MKNKEYINYAEESFKKLSEFLVEFKKDDWQFLIIANHKDGAGGIIGEVANPDMMKMVVLHFLLTTHQRVQENDTNNLGHDPLIMDILCQSVMQYFDRVTDIDKYKRFQRFSNGDLKGISEDEINEFLDIKVKLQCTEKLERGVHDKLHTVFLKLIDKYKITGNYLIPRLRDDIYNVFYEYREKAIIDNIYNQDAYNKKLTDIVTEVYLNNITGKSFIEDFEHETSKFITEVVSN